MQRRPSTSPQPRLRWAWLGASLGFTLAFITQAPAHWLTRAIEQASGKRVLLPDARGTVWNGSAQWVLNEGPLNTAVSANLAGSPANTTALPTRVTWQLGPRIDWAQLHLALSASITSTCCTPEPVQVAVSPMWRGVRVTVSNHTSSWPASWLVGLGAPWNTVQPEGQMQLQTTQLQWTHQAGQSQLVGVAELQMQQLSTRLSTLRPLGTYRVRVKGGTRWPSHSTPSRAACNSLAAANSSTGASASTARPRPRLMQKPRCLTYSTSLANAKAPNRF